MDKYFTKTNYQNGDIISMLITDLYNKNKNIIFIRTPTTGVWLDKLLVDKPNIIRILYDTNKIKKYKVSKSTKIIKSNNLEKKLDSLNKKYDLICIDPFHEYEYSKRDFFLLSSYLSDDGIIISHDCFPSNNNSALPKYILGNWSGETYIALVEFSYANPDLFYGILNIDTGIGIISKKNILFLKNCMNVSKQKHLLDLHNNKSNDVYDFFSQNAIDIINLFVPGN